MSELSKHPSFSVVQMAAAWLAGLSFGGGAFALVAFRSREWGAIFLAPLIAGAIVTVIAAVSYAINHWDDHP